MSNSKKQSFLGGAAILAAAVAVVKIIGAFYKFPLNNILGGEGKAYFNTAYYIYNVLLTISTAGLPLAISKLTSQAHAQGLSLIHISTPSTARCSIRTGPWRKSSTCLPSG